MSRLTPAFWTIIRKVLGILCVHVRCNFGSQSGKVPKFAKEGLLNVCCGRIFVEAVKVCNFCEPVYYYHYLSLPLQFRWLFDELGRNGGPGSIVYL